MLRAEDYWADPATTLSRTFSFLGLAALPNARLKAIAARPIAYLPGSNATYLNSDHWWFLQWELQGDTPLRYFLEPVVLTANYAESLGYEEINMAGLSGGGWSTTVASAVDKSIKGSFPIAGSVPCAMRNPTGKVRRRAAITAK